MRPPLLRNVARGDALDQMKDRSSKTEAATTKKTNSHRQSHAGQHLTPPPLPPRRTRSQVIFRRLVRAVGFESAPPRAWRTPRRGGRRIPLGTVQGRAANSAGSVRAAESACEVVPLRWLAIQTVTVGKKDQQGCYS